jgi:hypothetical protein
LQLVRSVYGEQVPKSDLHVLGNGRGAGCSTSIAVVHNGVRVITPQSRVPPRGSDVDASLAVRETTACRLTAVAVITTRNEIDGLDALRIDTVVGMAIYTGILDAEPPGQACS